MTNKQNGSDLIRALRSEDQLEAWRLLAIPVSVNMLDQRGTSALMVAAYRGYSDVCKRLIELGADVLHHVENDDLSEGAHRYDDAEVRAAMSQDAKTIRVVGRAAVEARWRSPAFAEVGPQLLVDAAGLGMTRLCVEMIESGVPVEPREEDNCNALRAAQLAKELGTSLVLLAMGADIQSVTSDGLFSYEFRAAWEKEQGRLRGKLESDG
jgi:uncharacterized protein